jgi:PIN domain nuclease of toxin-antitoxin system
MKLLLDTHIFLWLINQDSRLPKQWQQAIQNISPLQVEL